MSDDSNIPHKLRVGVALVHTTCRSVPGIMSVYANGGNRSADVPTVKRLTLAHNHGSDFNCEAIYGNATPGYAMLIGMNMTEADVEAGLSRVYGGDIFSTVDIENFALDNSNPKHAIDELMDIATDRASKHILPLTPITSQYAQGTIDVNPYKAEQPSAQSDVPLEYAPRLEIFQAEAYRVLKEKVKQPSIDVTDPIVKMYPDSLDTMAESQSATINNAPPPYVFFELEVNVDYDSASKTFSARLASEPVATPSEEDTAALDVIEAVNQKLKLDSLLVMNGVFKGSELPVQSPVVMPVRPSETLKGDRKAEYDSWWIGITQAYESLLSIDRTGDESAFNKWTKQNPDGSVDDYKALMSTEASKSTWADIANKVISSVGGAASKVWETITAWGPKDMVGAYGGFVAVNKAKELPAWVWAAGAGVVALILLK